MVNCNSTYVAEQYADALNASAGGPNTPTPYVLPGLITLTNPLVQNAATTVSDERLSSVLSGGAYDIKAPGLALRNVYRPETDLLACVADIHIKRDPYNYSGHRKRSNGRDRQSTPAPPTHRVCAPRAVQ